MVLYLRPYCAPMLEKTKNKKRCKKIVMCMVVLCPHVGEDPPPKRGKNQRDSAIFMSILCPHVGEDKKRKTKKKCCHIYDHIVSSCWRRPQQKMGKNERDSAIFSLILCPHVGEDKAAD